MLLLHVVDTIHPYPEALAYCPPGPPRAGLLRTAGAGLQNRHACEQVKITSQEVNSQSLALYSNFSPTVQLHLFHPSLLSRVRMLLSPRFESSLHVIITLDAHEIVLVQELQLHWHLSFL